QNDALQCLDTLLPGKRGRSGQACGGPGYGRLERRVWRRPCGSSIDEIRAEMPVSDARDPGLRARARPCEIEQIIVQRARDADQAVALIDSPPEPAVSRLAHSVLQGPRCPHRYGVEYDRVDNSVGR